MTGEDEGHWDGTHPEDVLAREAGGAEPPTWHVIVEETTGFGRDSQRWAVSEVRPCEDREEALDLAEKFALEYRSEHPASPRARRVFQIGEDSWLVDVEGAMRSYHFRVSTARLVKSE